MKRQGSVFYSAIVGSDGEVDAGYLALFWIMLVVISLIPLMAGGSLLEMLFDPLHKFSVKDLGIGVGSVCGGFGVAVGAVGAFRLGDRGREPHYNNPPAPYLPPDTTTEGGCK